MKLFLIIASILGFLFVAIGAFGAHALSERLAETGRTDTFETGVLYHMIHTVAILAVAILTRYLSATGLLHGAGWAFTAGIIIFSGSLYALSLTGIRVFGAVAPIGGTAFLAGWVLIFIAAINE